MREIQDRLAEAIIGAGRVLVATHVNPDGDAIGSAAALAHIALHSGSEVRILLGSARPDFLSWLPLPAPEVRTPADLGPWKPDLLLLADCAEIGRTEPELASMLLKKEWPDQGSGRPLIANIDHHVSNPGFGHLNWVEPSRSAAGELVGLLAEHMGIPLSGPIGEAVYLTLVSDTGNFSFSNTGSGCLAMAARLVDAGLDIAAFTAKFENTWSLARMHLWGRLLSEIRLHEDGAVSCCIVPKRYLDESGLGKADLDGFAACLRRLRGVRVGLFIREDGLSRCKVSLRSMGDVNVNAIASLYGGGGHAAAAGAELDLAPEAAEEKVLAGIRPFLPSAAGPPR